MMLSFLENQGKSFRIILTCVLILVLGFSDYLTGHEIAFGTFYLLPVSLAAWYLGRRAGIVTSFICTIVWLITDITAGQTYLHPFISYLNAIVRLIFFLAVSSLLSALYDAYLHQKELARTDHLTEVANRRFFYELTEMEINRARRYAHPFTLAYVDVDNFKAVNDRFGHSVGDRLLKIVSGAVKSNLRATDVVARLGGDEFAILLPETGNEAAQVVIQKVQQTLLGEMQKNGWSVTFSIGVVTCLDPPRTVEELVNLGDELVYAAKSNGKNSVQYDIMAAKLVSIEK